MRTRNFCHGPLDHKCHYFWYKHYSQQSIDYRDYLLSEFQENKEFKIWSYSRDVEALVKKMLRYGGTLEGNYPGRTIKITLDGVNLKWVETDGLYVSIDNRAADILNLSPEERNTFFDRYEMPNIEDIYRYYLRISTLSKTIIDLNDYIGTEQFHKDEEAYLKVTTYIQEVFEGFCEIIPFHYGTNIYISFMGEGKFRILYDESKKIISLEDDWKHEIIKLLEPVFTKLVPFTLDRRKEYEKFVLLCQGAESNNTNSSSHKQYVSTPEDIIKLHDDWHRFESELDEVSSAWNQNFFGSHCSKDSSILSELSMYISMIEQAPDHTKEKPHKILHLKEPYYLALYDLSLRKFSITLDKEAQEVFLLDNSHRELYAEPGVSIRGKALRVLNQVLKIAYPYIKKYRELLELYSSGRERDAINQVYGDMAPYLTQDDSDKPLYSLKMSMKDSILEVTIEKHCLFEYNADIYFKYDFQNEEDSDFISSWRPFFEEWRTKEMAKNNARFLLCKNVKKNLKAYLKALG